MTEPTTDKLRERWRCDKGYDPNICPECQIMELCDRLDAADKRIAELEQTCKDLATQVVRFKGECDAAHREPQRPATEGGSDE